MQRLNNAYIDEEPIKSVSLSYFGKEQLDIFSTIMKLINLRCMSHR